MVVVMFSVADEVCGEMVRENKKIKIRRILLKASTTPGGMAACLDNYLSIFLSLILPRSMTRFF